jgi:hypothetical protein
VRCESRFHRRHPYGCPGPPQVGERLARRTDGVLHCSRSDGIAFGGDSAISVTLGEDLDDGDWVGAIAQERVEVDFQSELFPEHPMRIHRFGAFKSDPSACLFLDKAEVSAESISSQGGDIYQGRV